jgi:small subunit ribosomal protein S8
MIKMMNDTLANTLNNINLATKTGKTTCTVRPTSKIIVKVLEIMQDSKYIGSFEIIKNNKGGEIKINLIGALNKCGAIKPRFSVDLNNFEKFEKRYLPAKDFGLIIVSTSKGIMVHNEAKEKKIGGRLLAYVY